VKAREIKLGVLTTTIYIAQSSGCKFCRAQMTLSRVKLLVKSRFEMEGNVPQRKDLQDLRIDLKDKTL